MVGTHGQESTFLFSVIDLFGQKSSDLKSMSLSGDIKKIIQYRYSNIKSRHHNWEPRDISKWYLKEIQEFNKEGDVDRITEVHKSRATNKTLITKFEHLHDTITSKSWDETGSLTFASKVIWKSRE